MKRFLDEPSTSEGVVPLEDRRRSGVVKSRGVWGGLGPYDRVLAVRGDRDRYELQREPPFGRANFSLRNGRRGGKGSPREGRVSGCDATKIGKGHEGSVVPFLNDGLLGPVYPRTGLKGRKLKF